jgi:hypothetical protein
MPIYVLHGENKLRIRTRSPTAAVLSASFRALLSAVSIPAFSVSVAIRDCLKVA